MSDFQLPRVKTGWIVDFSNNKGREWVPMIVLEVSDRTIGGIAFFPNGTVRGVDQAWHETDPQVKTMAVAMQQMNDVRVGTFRLGAMAELMMIVDDLKKLAGYLPELRSLVLAEERRRKGGRPRKGESSEEEALEPVGAE